MADDPHGKSAPESADDPSSLPAPDPAPERAQPVKVELPDGGTVEISYTAPVKVEAPDAPAEPAADPAPEPE